jgi:outer membrane cobalamin receptor
MARLAARAAVTPWLSFFASGARAVRVPTLGETFGASAVLRGNPALREESGLGAEAGARLEAGAPTDAVRASLEVLGFARFADDLIAYRRTSLGGVRPFNVGHARILGGEVSAAADVMRHVRADVALTALDPRDLDAEDTLRDLLPHQARLVVAPALTLYADDPIDAWPVDRASLASRLLFRSERVANVLDDQATDTLGLPLPGRSVHVAAEVWWN